MNKKDNILIAEFMGFQKTNIGWYDSEDSLSLSYTNDNTFDILLFDESWDWLMPVVEKIESQQAEGYNILIEGANCWIETQGISFEGMGMTKLEATYKAVLEFIKWYDKNK